MYKRFFKRILDILVSLIAIIILSPVFLIVAIIVKIKLGSPILFFQERPGLNEKIFKMYKFRSMTDERDVNGHLLPDHLRLTKFGKLLRSTSLDELPGLYNVLNGSLSIVGPRPLLVQYLPYYTTEERKRHSVRPGLTGLAQINGRNNLPWDERLKLDIKYVENIRFLNDFKIILKTIERVIKRVDVAEKRITPLNIQRSKK